MNVDNADLQHFYNQAWLFASQAHWGQKMKGWELAYSTHVAMVANELIFADREESGNGISSR
jgi:(p)ppGpp synthase/HD superfamily hydrolase